VRESLRGIAREKEGPRESARGKERERERERRVEKQTWNSKDILSCGMKKSSSRNCPLSLFFKSPCFLAFVIICNEFQKKSHKLLHA
jgi:hypothetical protein